MICRYLRFVTCDAKEGEYEVWVCGFGLPGNEEVDLGTARFCTLKDMEPCPVEGGPFAAVGQGGQGGQGSQ